MMDNPLKYVRFLIIFTLTVLSEKIYPQDFRFEKITTFDGLANNNVSGIIQDKRGFIWFSTNDGINRYDSKEFRLFEYEPFNPDSLRNNFIKTIFYDYDKDFIWIGTKEGLCILNPVTEKILNVSLSNIEAQKILDGEITAIKKDSKGDFWVGTTNGLVKIDDKTKDSTVYLHNKEDPLSLPDNNIKDILCDSKNNIWVSTYNGIALYKNETFINYFQNYKRTNIYSNTEKFTSIEEISMGLLLIGCWGEGVILFDPVSKEYSVNKLGDNRIYTIEYDTRGHIWVGTWGGGIYYFNNLESIKRNNYIKISHEQDNEYSLSSNIIYSIFEDSSARIWVGTDGSGVNKLNQMQRSYKYHFHIGETYKIENNGVSSLLIDNRDNLWVGSTKNGIYIFDNENKNKEHYGYNPDNFNSLSSNNVNSLLIDSMENIWVFTDSGLDKFNRKTKSFEHYYIDGKKILNYRKNADIPINIADNKFYSGKEDEYGRLWLGTSNGVYIWDKASGITTHFSKDLPPGKRLSDNTVYAIDINKDGIVWIGTDNGLNSFNPATNTIDIYNHNSYDTHSLSSNSIKAIYCDSAGNVWIGTSGGGVSVFNKDKNNFYSFTKEEGLEHNTAMGLTEDQKGNIIAVTFMGISMIAKKANIELSTVTSLTNHFGLNRINFYGGITKDKNGNIFIGTMEEIYKINTAFYYLNKVNSEIVITDLKIFDKSYLDIFGKNIFAEKETSLKWYDGHISFDFSAIDYSFSEGRKYKYILEGFDKEWIYSGERNYASYTSIPPGNYIFRVTGTNSSGIWSTKEASLKINIIPPFYRTPIAYLFYLLAIAAFFYGIIIIVKGGEVSKRLDEVSRLKDELLTVNLQLERQTRIDNLTGVHNRKHFEEIFGRLWDLYIRTKLNFSVLMLDIDYFKNFNDTYGHVAGDKAIKTVADIILEAMNRKTDSVFRYGGEEFVILLVDTDLTGSRIVAERIRKKVEEKKIQNGSNEKGIRYITVSIGISYTNAVNPETAAQLLAAADENLYKAKDLGRNRIV